MSLRLFYDNVTVIDYAYLDQQQGVVGGSLIVDIELEGEVNTEGVIFDFSQAKKRIKQIIDLNIDHRLLVPQREKNLTLQQTKNNIELSFRSEQGEIVYSAPLEGVVILEVEKLSLDVLARFIEKLLLGEMPVEVKQVQVGLRVESGEVQNFLYYSHGLKQHDGNCQRLLHGHRSKLEVLKEGTRCVKLERWLRDDLFKRIVHFAFKKNILVESTKKIEIGYTAGQGEFFCALPSKLVHILPMETTVENLSHYFYQCLQEEYGEQKIEVIAFEGIGKGAKYGTIENE